MIMSAGVVVVRNENGIWKVLFLRAYKNWGFPKGIVVTGEGPVETAKREVIEETGITDLKFPWGKNYKDTPPYRSRGEKIARYYLGQTSQAKVTFSVNPELGRPEHHEYRWVTWDEIKMLAPERLLHIIEWANRLVLNG